MSSLRGVRVLVTRPRGQASALAESLEGEGAIPIVIPTIEIAPPASWDGLDTAINTLSRFDWVLFTSANAVSAFADRAAALHLAACPRQVAVIGPATGKAVEQRLGRQPDLVPSRFVAEALLDALLPHAPGSNMLLVRAAEARDLLPSALAHAGAHVTIAEAYRNVVPAAAKEQLTSLFESHPPDAVVFTSASTVRNLADLLAAVGLKLPDEIVTASIGPITSAAMREADFEVSVEASESTIPSLIAALRNRTPVFRPGAS